MPDKSVGVPKRTSSYTHAIRKPRLSYIHAQRLSNTHRKQGHSIYRELADMIKKKRSSQNDEDVEQETHAQ